MFVDGPEAARHTIVITREFKERTLEVVLREVI
jgi:hypothetical protein